mgnify:CR=1 FL=1
MCAPRRRALSIDLLDQEMRAVGTLVIQNAVDGIEPLPGFLRVDIGFHVHRGLLADGLPRSRAVVVAGSCTRARGRISRDTRSEERGIGESDATTRLHAGANEAPRRQEQAPLPLAVPGDRHVAPLRHHRIDLQVVHRRRDLLDHLQLERAGDAARIAAQQGQQPVVIAAPISYAMTVRVERQRRARAPSRWRRAAAARNAAAARRCREKPGRGRARDR